MKKTGKRRFFCFLSALVCGSCSQSFAACCATTVQNFTTAGCCHSGTETVCANTTCLGWLICTFCCHDFYPCLFFFLFFVIPSCPSSIISTMEKIRLCVYLTIGFIKTQQFYLDFINPTFFRPSTVIQNMNKYTNNFQTGKNICLFPWFQLLGIVLQNNMFVNMFFQHYFLTKSAKICYVLYVIKHRKGKYV